MQNYNNNECSMSIECVEDIIDSQTGCEADIWNEEGERFDPVRRITEYQRNRDNHLMIFDWDDTLFPTFEVTEGNWGCFTKNVFGRNPPRKLRKLIAKIEAAAIEIIEQAASLGTVKVVTYATFGWAHRTCKTFMPNLQAVLVKHNAELISAREDGLKRGMKSSWHMKTESFRKLVDERLKTTNLPITLTSVGDGSKERRAALEMCKFIPENQISIIKLLDKPSGNELLLQLEELSKIFEHISTSNEFVYHEMQLEKQFAPQPKETSWNCCFLS